MGCESSLADTSRRARRVFQSPPSRGMGCEALTTTCGTAIGFSRFNPLLRGAWAARAGKPKFFSKDRATSFNPLLRGAWAARRPKGLDRRRQDVLRFNPLLRGAWAASSGDWEFIAEINAEFQSPPSRGMGCEPAWRLSHHRGRLPVSIPSFAGHGLRARRTPSGRPPGRRVFQSPPSRGMGCENDAVWASFGEESWEFQSPPSRGMGCESSAAASRRPAAPCWFQSPPSRGMGCESDAWAWAPPRLAAAFQSPPSRGMGCEARESG